MNRGKSFEKEVKASLDAYGFYSMRIADKLYWTGKRIASEETPADFLAYYATDRVIPVMIECKATAQKSLEFARLQEHQRKALTEFEAYHSDCRSFVAVNFYDSDSLRSRNLCYMIPIAVWIEYTQGERKSISMKQCEEDERIVKCPRDKGSKFNLENLCESLKKGIANC